MPKLWLPITDKNGGLVLIPNVEDKSELHDLEQMAQEGGKIKPRPKKPQGKMSKEDIALFLKDAKKYIDRGQGVNKKEFY